MKFPKKTDGFLSNLSYGFSHNFVIYLGVPQLNFAGYFFAIFWLGEKA